MITFLLKSIQQPEPSLNKNINGVAKGKNVRNITLAPPTSIFGPKSDVPIKLRIFLEKIAEIAPVVYPFCRDFTASSTGVNPKKLAIFFRIACLQFLTAYTNDLETLSKNSLFL